MTRDEDRALLKSRKRFNLVRYNQDQVQQNHQQHRVRDRSRSLEPLKECSDGWM